MSPRNAGTPLVTRAPKARGTLTRAPEAPGHLPGRCRGDALASRDHPPVASTSSLNQYFMNFFNRSRSFFELPKGLKGQLKHLSTKARSPSPESHKNLKDFLECLPDLLINPWGEPYAEGSSLMRPAGFLKIFMNRE